MDVIYLNFAGLESISMDMKEKKMTVTGEIDPVVIVSKLRKVYQTEIISVGPAKEPEKKKEDSKKKEDPKNKDESKKDGSKNQAQGVQVTDLSKASQAYPQYLYPPHYLYPQYLYPIHCCVSSVEEDPNACVICWASNQKPKDE